MPFRQTAVVAQLNYSHVRDPLACNMLCCLALLQALYDFCLRAVHITGALNTEADQLSRNNVAAFLAYYSCTSSFPSQVCLSGASRLDISSLEGVLHKFMEAV